MSGRRSHARFAVSPVSEGVFRVLHDVVVQPSPPGEVVVISREPGIIEERLALDVPEAEHGVVGVRVVESRPLVVDGSVRHRLKLEVVEELP